MKIAIVGTRGVPAAYSGFETCAEQVGKRLVRAGHSVVVYCRAGRTGHADQHYLGMRRVVLPAIPNKALETLSHSLLSISHAALRARPDVILIFGVGNALFCFPMRRQGIPVAINVDGADWARPKWGAFGRRFLKWSERVAAHRGNAVIADSHAVAAHYRDAYGVEATYIPYGAEIHEMAGTASLERFGLRSRGYLLAVGRFVPENGLHDLIAAYARLAPTLPFVVVGDAPYSAAYKRRLRELAGPGVIFTGYQFGEAYQELSAHALAFVFGAEVGGTHPVLVEQLAHGNVVIARWTASNEEVAGDAALFFRSVDELVEQLRRCLGDSALVARARRRSLKRALSYSWETVTGQYEQLLAQLAGARVADRPATGQGSASPPPG